MWIWPNTLFLTAYQHTYKFPKTGTPICHKMVECLQFCPNRCFLKSSVWTLLRYLFNTYTNGTLGILTLGAVQITRKTILAFLQVPPPLYEIVDGIYYRSIKKIFWCLTIWIKWSLGVFRNIRMQKLCKHAKKSPLIGQ